MGEYTFNDYYIKMMQNATDPELKEYFRGKLERARLIVNSVDRRRETITRIVRAILELQNSFFLGQGPLLPMTMEQIANELDISTSTVSRAIKNKYIQYRRPLLLRDLFTAPAGDQADVSSDKVRARIDALVRQEDHTRPLSDDKIACILKQEGIRVSRRTVAKYRQQMGIPDSRVRVYL
jgi:RNA polymerase sigma-54 factor